MIGRVYRGRQVCGLLRYLYGPGRHNEHDNPHLVAAWDLTTPLELATLEPRVLAGEGAKAMRDFAPMTGSLELATAFRPLTDKAAAKVVWHCPLRTAPADRRLSDEEWGEVARDVMHQTGIAERGDDGGCRWIAVRHDEESVHLVAVLARQDGQAVRIGNDFRHLREACRAAEQRLGLVGTAPADLTADRHTTRAEVEKADRAGRAPDRDWLREQVQVAALTSGQASEFVGRLRAAGVVVRERTDREGALTGYAVGRPAEPGEKELLFGGGKLAPDLSLPRLRARWRELSAGSIELEASLPATRQLGVAGELAAALRARNESNRRLAMAQQACAQASAFLQDAAGRPGRLDGQAVAELLSAAGDMARAVALVLGEAGEPSLTAGVREFDRATRPAGGAAVTSTRVSQPLRQSTVRLLHVERAVLRGMRANPELVRLLLQLHALIETVRDVRLVQRQQAQAEAASRAARQLSQAHSHLAAGAAQAHRPTAAWTTAAAQVPRHERQR